MVDMKTYDGLIEKARGLADSVLLKGGHAGADILAMAQTMRKMEKVIETLQKELDDFGPMLDGAIKGREIFDETPTLTACAFVIGRMVGDLEALEERRGLKYRIRPSDGRFTEVVPTDVIHR